MANETEIQFVETDAEVVESALVAAFEQIAGRTLHPADPERMFLLWATQIIVQLRVLLNESARQNIPRYAKGEVLDVLAEELFHKVSRISASAAMTTIKFTMSKPAESARLIPQGTRVATDDGIVFETTEDVYLPIGETEVEIGAKCQTTGTIGNGRLPGQINILVDVFPFYDHCENTTTSEGGAEEETDESLYQRMRASEDTYSTAGPVGGYEYHTKSVSSAIVDVVANSPKPGTVVVYPLLSGGKIPEEEMLASIKAAVNDETIRPLTDQVLVSPPETVKYSIDLTYYIPTGANAAAIEQAVTAAVTEYKNWQSGKLGRDINPQQLIYLLKQAGVKRAEIREPQFIPVSDGGETEAAQVALLQNELIQNGGYEDE